MFQWMMKLPKYWIVIVVLADLRVNEWSTALKEFYRILKPGGVIGSIECGQIGRGRELAEDLSERVTAFMQSRGQDSSIALKIPSHMADARFETFIKDISLGTSGK
ncbi:hypothetical protein BC941DRAFT_474497 [Chlamydoabsidia padenii]|nr:hypothetical protein BC941DRAFT_474497 [Chlamydoabsidia padenii]